MIPDLGLLHHAPVLLPEQRGVQHDQESLGQMEGQEQHWLRPRLGQKLDCNAGNELTVASTDPWVLPLKAMMINKENRIVESLVFLYAREKWFKVHASLLQGMFGVGNDARKRSSYGYQTVTTVTTMTDDRRGTQETEVLKTNESGGANSHQGETGNGNRNWRSRDGPLVPQPDLVQQISGGGSNTPSS